MMVCFTILIKITKSLAHTASSQPTLSFFSNFRKTFFLPKFSKTLTLEMAASTSSSDSLFAFPKNFPINIIACEELFSTDLSLEMEGKSLNLVMEQPVDFDSLEKNHFDVLKFFIDHNGSFKYMELLNGPIYPTLVKDFWVKSKVKTVEDYK